MAVVINGTTGIDTIQDDAVGLAQMASGTDGNLITYDASGDPAAVAVGTSGQVLTSNGAGAAPTMQAGGKVLQVVSTTKTARFSTTYNGFVDVTDLNVSIIPQTGSNILVFVHINMGGNYYESGFRILRDSTAIAIANNATHRLTSGNAWNTNSGDWTNTDRPNLSHGFLDTSVGGDGTTSIVYKVQVNSNTNGCFVNGRNNSSQVSTITVMEIGA